MKPFGFPIHGAMDGFSWKILWLEVTRSNNSPDNTATYFLSTVKELKGCPRQLITDLGTENLELEGVLYSSSELSMECLWNCFAPVIQKDPDIVKEHWNSHRIR
ncbi:unnamed protein product [Pocillopora meandrina]|uniref:Integrase catalytic domain-containing protein n=1 Tax=Pocillopora meandrina TaxID=46732 RepID=A0AAU9XCD2_9CNID|nr:unnamed protein product [Pocillopora meandrina]